MTQIININGYEFTPESIVGTVWETGDRKRVLVVGIDNCKLYPIKTAKLYTNSSILGFSYTGRNIFSYKSKRDLIRPIGRIQYFDEGISEKPISGNELTAKSSSEEISDDWIPWHGGECPVDGDAILDVQVEYEHSGNVYVRRNVTPALYNWGGDFSGGNARVVAYRVVGRVNTHADPKQRPRNLMLSADKMVELVREVYGKLPNGDKWKTPREAVDFIKIIEDTPELIGRVR